MNNLRSENFLILWFRCKLDEERSAFISAVPHHRRHH